MNQAMGEAAERRWMGAAVALGSALGAVVRTGVSITLLAGLGPSLPWGTLLVNVGGAFLIGWLAQATGPGARWAMDPVRREFWSAGFCGGFTTFSIFSLELVLRWPAWPAWAWVGYVVASVLLWLGACALGWRMGRRMLAPAEDA